MDEQEAFKKTTDYIVTETTVDPGAPVAEVIAYLVARHTTGQLLVYMSQGSMQKITLTERTRATVQESDRIREILEWEDPK
jgi:hypothetical protein